MEKLKRCFQELENELFKSYDILSNAGFEILIEDGSMLVFLKDCNIEMNIEEGIVINSNESTNELQRIARVTDIDWCMDSEDEEDWDSDEIGDLPSEVIVYLDDEEDEDEIEEIILDFLSEEYGFLTNCFSYKIEFK
ncbi:MAG: hypothetical protein ACKOX3_02130 [Bacteroidota bacterium]